MKKLIAFRLAPDVIELIRLLHERLGLSQAAIVELAIRSLARSKKVSLDDNEKRRPP